MGKKPEPEPCHVFPPLTHHLCEPLSNAPLHNGKALGFDQRAQFSHQGRVRRSGARTLAVAALQLRGILGLPLHRRRRWVMVGGRASERLAHLRVTPVLPHRLVIHRDWLLLLLLLWIGLRVSLLLVLL